MGKNVYLEYGYRWEGNWRRNLQFGMLFQKYFNLFVRFSSFVYFKGWKIAGREFVYIVIVVFIDFKSLFHEKKTIE